MTLDLLTSDGVFRGGLISPGLQMRLDAMHTFTSSLPQLKISEQAEYPGKSTQESMQLAGIQSLIFETKGYLDLLKEQFEDLIVVDCTKHNKYFESVVNYKNIRAPKISTPGSRYNSTA